VQILFAYFQYFFAGANFVRPHQLRVFVVIFLDTVNREGQEYNRRKRYKIYIKSLSVQAEYLFVRFRTEHIEVVSFSKGLLYLTVLNLGPLVNLSAFLNT
jgi:hypothetical protein